MVPFPSLCPVFYHKQKLLKHLSCQERFHCSLWFYFHLIALLNTCIPIPVLLPQFSTLSVFFQQPKEEQ